MAGNIPNKDRRKELREHILGLISWAYASDGNRPSLKGGILNMSRSGVSILTQEPVGEGNRLKIHCGSLWRGNKCATVKWCAMVDFDIFRIGLEFVGREVKKT